MKQESRSSSSSSPTVGEIQVREREDATNSDISPVPMFNLVDDGPGHLLDEQRQMIIAEYRKKSRSSRTPSSSRRRRAPTSTRTIMATKIGIS